MAQKIYELKREEIHYKEVDEKVCRWMKNNVLFSSTKKSSLLQKNEKNIKIVS
jgi:hypothetical protein